LNPQLIALAGPLRGQALPLAEDCVRIGRDPENEVCLSDAWVSRRHCVLERLPDGQVRLRDLGSRNGTFVQGLPVRERILRHGDEIRVGRSVLVFLCDAAEPAPAGARNNPSPGGPWSAFPGRNWFATEWSSCWSQNRCWIFPGRRWVRC
jgi:pSer/pThr/pTyr-binding forkhead associated (FHA) protein